ncbi:sugar phosphate isomerase/epimerase [Novosphingobium sp. P6W]|uniref:sugar phosphate isomerase/epimerase family protein n=1 Tax=Novosphingobium sp. P6W TaxID=1609758 RepID=UPI0005C6DC62|nr:sugar phosphate isomerase/epimerase [Novosphingobium sp. P6W]AXB80138.1 sugar phosphate isomerase/epimerase [Novosphingobium sp. P6W]
MDRRAFLSSGLIAVTTAFVTVPACGAKEAGMPFFQSHQLSMGVQLFALAADLARDFDGTLQAVAKTGYRTVELAGYHDRTATQIRLALDAAGLSCRGIHVQPDPVAGRSGPSLNGDIAAIITDSRALGTTDVILPIFLMPRRFVAPAGADRIRTLRAAGEALVADDWKYIADFLNAKGRELQSEGLRMGYHNHHFEFAPLRGGTTGFDILLRETDPSLVFFELDVGWVMGGGSDPVDMLQAHQGRFAKMHVKDVVPSTNPDFEGGVAPTEVGSGMIDWRRLLPAAYAAGVRDFVVEQEPPFAGPPIDSLAKSFAYLNQIETA